MDNYNSNDVKDVLKKNTDECINLGSFGAPIILVEVNG